MFLFTAVAAVVLYLVQFVWHFDDPLATLVISTDSKVLLNQETVLELSEAALRQIDLEPIRPHPYGPDNDPERFMGRNAFRPDDEVTVNWRVRGGSYPSYSVRLSREESGIKATISENWL